MDVVLLLMVLGVMLSGFWAADALDHMRKEILRQEGKRRGWWSSQIQLRSAVDCRAQALSFVGE